MINNSSIISKGGLFTALSVIFLYLCFIVPTNSLGFLFLSSTAIVASIIKIGFKHSILIYCSTSIISFILGLKGITLAYLLIFGSYPLIKYQIESLRKIYLEFILKFVFSIMCFFLCFYLFNYLLINIPFIAHFSIYFLILGFLICFFIYDYLLTLICQYIVTKFKKL